MPDADAFADAAFLGLARAAKRDPYRLSLFAEHLAPDERALAVLPVQGGTLVVTGRRLLELRAHLEVHGAWNVKEFQGYAVHRAVDRSTVRGLSHEVRGPPDAPGSRWIEDRILLTTAAGPQDFLVSRGPERTLPEEDFETLRAIVLGPQAK